MDRAPINLEASAISTWGSPTHTNVQPRNSAALSACATSAGLLPACSRTPRGGRNAAGSGSVSNGVPRATHDVTLSSRVSGFRH
jgi:hypothetical protein